MKIKAMVKHNCICILLAKVSKSDKTKYGKDVEK